MVANPTNKYFAKGLYWHSIQRRLVEPFEVKHLKQNNKKACKDILFFASMFEFQVYKQLVQLFGFHAVTVQYQINLIPPGFCYPKGKSIKIDFAIKPDIHTSRPFMLIEAKGVVTETFQANLAILEQTNRVAFNSLYLLFDRFISSNRLINHLIRSGLTKTELPKILTLSQFTELQIKSFKGEI